MKRPVFNESSVLRYVTRTVDNVMLHPKCNPCHCFIIIVRASLLPANRVTLCIRFRL